MNQNMENLCVSVSSCCVKIISALWHLNYPKKWDKQRKLLELIKVNFSSDQWVIVLSHYATPFISPKILRYDLHHSTSNKSNRISKPPPITTIVHYCKYPVLEPSLSGNITGHRHNNSRDCSFIVHLLSTYHKSIKSQVKRMLRTRSSHQPGIMWPRIKSSHPLQVGFQVHSRHLFHHMM